MSADAKTQNLSNHARYVPGYHYVTGSLTIIVLVWTLYRLVVDRNGTALLGALIGVVLTAQFWYLRAFPIAVQNRVIRLEERLRFAKLLPPDLLSRCGELTAGQIIALRFASDAELPALTRRVLDEKIVSRKDIKALIVNWRPDVMRA